MSSESKASKPKDNWNNRIINPTSAPYLEGKFPLFTEKFVYTFLLFFFGALLLIIEFQNVGCARAEISHLNIQSEHFELKLWVLKRENLWTAAGPIEFLFFYCFISCFISCFKLGESLTFFILTYFIRPIRSRLACEKAGKWVGKWLLAGSPGTSKSFWNSPTPPVHCWTWK